MDKMSIIIILIVSIPEAILNIYLSFVLTGQRSKLYLDDRYNRSRLLISSLLMVLTSIMVRRFIPIFSLAPFVSMTIYISILKFVYNMEWKDAIINVIIFVGFLATVESTYVYQFIAFLDKGIGSYFSNDIIRIISSIPERGFQLFVIISFWKWDLVYLNLKCLGNKSIFYSFMILAFCLLTVESLVTFSFICNIDKFTLVFKVIYSVSCLAFGIINMLLCKFTIMLTRSINTA